MKHSILTAALQCSITIIVLASPHLGGQRGAAQTKFQITIGGTNGDKGYSVYQTSDGGYIITGSTKSFGAGNDDVYLVKTDASGNVSWSRTFGGPNNDAGYSVRQTSDGGYIIAGEYDFYNFPTVYSKVYLIKTDGNGNLTWSKTFSKQANAHHKGNCVQQTSDGGYIISALLNRSSPYGIYLVKTDANGNLTWSTTYSGVSNHYGSVQQTTDGGYIVAGGCYYNSNYEAYMVKTDANGNVSWSKTYGGASPDNEINMFLEINPFEDMVKQTDDGGYIFTGYTTSFGSGGADIYLVKTDGSGNLTWSKTFGGTGNDYGKGIHQTSDGGYTIVGSTASFGSGNVYLVKTDANGDISWSKTFGTINAEDGFSLQQTSDGGYIIVGTIFGIGAGNTDIYLIKTD